MPSLDAPGTPPPLYATIESAEAQARRAARVLDTVADAHVTLDRDFRITYVNAEAARINKKPAEAFVGRLHWDEWPAAIGTEFERQFRRAMIERVAVRFVENYRVAGEYDDWIEVTAYPADEEDGGGLHLVYRDVTQRVRRERREKFLADLAERARRLTDPDALIADAVRSLGEFLGVSRCTFADIDAAADTCTIHPDYCADDTVAGIAGIYPWSAFGPFVADELGQGRVVAVKDVRSDSVKVPQGYAAAYDAIGVRAHITAPAVYSARLVSVVSAQSATPREWKSEEIDLVQTVTERTWLTVEIARQQRILREAEQRERTRLNDIFTRVPAFMAALRGPDHVFEMANPSYYQVIGHRELVGKPVAEALPEITEQGFVALLDRVYRTGEPFTGSGVSVLLQTEPDGPLSERFLDFTYQPLRDEDGAVTGILIHGTDVTELKRLETARRRSEERFRSLVEATAQIIWEMRDDGAFATEQPQWAAYTGQAFGEYGGTGWLDAVHPEDREETLNAWREAVRTRTLYQGEHRLRRFDGVYRYFAVRAAPVLEADGAVREWIGVHSDVTERKEAEGRERFLSDITARMRILLDPEEVLYETAKAVGEYTGAHRCLYIEVDEEADTLTIRRDYVRDVASIAGTFPLDSFGPPIIENLRVGNITQSDDTECDPRLGPEHRATFRALNFRAFLGVPLHKAGRWVAILAIHFAQPRAWTPEEAELLVTVVERTWLAVENARLFRAQQEDAAKNERIAETLQRSLLVTPPPDKFPGIELATDYESAWDEAQIGGDFHDTFALGGGRVALVVGDATGKGLAAAARTAEVKYALRAYLRENPDPADALGRLNRFLVNGQRFDGKQSDDLSCVAIALTVLNPETGASTCASGGAEPPLLVRAATGVSEEVPVRGPLVGAIDEAVYEAARFTLGKGDLVVMTTDGITEARDPNDRRRFFADNGYAQVAQEGLRGAVGLGESAKNITAQAKAFAGGRLHDDVCLLLARLT